MLKNSVLLQGLTHLELQSRLGDNPLKFQVVCPQHGTAAVEASRLTAAFFLAFTVISVISIGLDEASLRFTLAFLKTCLPGFSRY